MTDPTGDAVRAYVQKRSETIREYVRFHIWFYGPSTRNQIYQSLDKREEGKLVSLCTLKIELRKMLAEENSIYEKIYEPNNPHVWIYKFKENS